VHVFEGAERDEDDVVERGEDGGREGVAALLADDGTEALDNPPGEAEEEAEEECPLEERVELAEDASGTEGALWGWMSVSIMYCGLGIATMWLEVLQGVEDEQGRKGAEKGSEWFT
jgi:hypothetical protein